MSISWIAFPGKVPVCRDCGADWMPVRRGECVECGSDAGPLAATDREPCDECGAARNEPCRDGCTEDQDCRSIP